jgi:hypothetical protein
MARFGDAVVSAPQGVLTDVPHGSQWLGTVGTGWAWTCMAWRGFTKPTGDQVGKNEARLIAEATNGAAKAIAAGEPYNITVTISGVADFLFHRWNCEAVEAKSKAAKNSAAKKSDDIESYVYRTDDGELAIPGEYLRQSVIAAAKFRQDPRSPRKSAMDLYKAGVVALTLLAPLGKKEWDYEDKRRVVIQRNGVNRVRPAMRMGWKATFDMLVTLPEYIAPSDLNDVIQTAGRLIGVGDFRPTFGRFQVTAYTA